MDAKTLFGLALFLEPEENYQGFGDSKQ